jgi:hypothetical protein
VPVEVARPCHHAFGNGDWTQALLVTLAGLSLRNASLAATRF